MAPIPTKGLIICIGEPQNPLGKVTQASVISESQRYRHCLKILSP